MKSKICGISDSKTLKYLTSHLNPPQYIGFIVNYPKSKRFVKLDKLKDLLEINKKNSEYVAVLVNPNKDILEKIKNLPFDYYQIYDCTPSKIESIIGSGTDVMQSLIDRQHSFDLIFIDADKNNYPNYYELSLSLLPPNGIIIIDNMLWHGDVADTSINDSQTKTIRDLNNKINSDDRIEFSLLPLSDGLLFIRKK